MELLRMGYKMSHVFFYENEYIMFRSTYRENERVTIEHDTYVFESGDECPVEDFWAIRTEKDWDCGWYLHYSEFKGWTDKRGNLHKVSDINDVHLHNILGFIHSDRCNPAWPIELRDGWSVALNREINKRRNKRV